MTIAAKAVIRWTWFRMLRDHSPLQASTLLTMFVIGTFMDEDGFTFVGQKRIAEGARASARTVQRHIEAAKRLGWLHVELVRVNSKRNLKRTFMNNYRSAVPADLELPEKDEELRDCMLSRAGDLDEGHDTAVSLPSLEGDDTQSRRTRHPEPKVTTPRVEGDDIAMSQEVFSLKSSVLSHQWEGALARTPAEKTTSKKSSKTKKEPAHISDVLAKSGVSHQEVQHERKAPEPKPAMRSREEQSAALRKMMGSA